MALSERQKRILEFLREFTREHGYPPTIREIGGGVGITSASVVNYNLKALQREGHIFRDKTVSRGIRLAEDITRGDMVSVPLLGRIAAGAPIDTPGTNPFAGETIDLPDDIVPHADNIFALEVRGTSMIDALINDGDIVIMEHRKEANNGEMVAVWLKDEQETTLKRFYLDNSEVRLQPENPAMQPIYTSPENVEIQGKVIAVIRRT